MSLRVSAVDIFLTCPAESTPPPLNHLPLTYLTIYLWTLKFWVSDLAEKNTWIMANLKSRQNSVNQIFNLNAFFFFFWTVVLWYYRAILEYLNMLHHLHAMKMIFLKLFQISMFKNPNLADIFTNLAENQKISWTPRSSWSLFFQVWVHLTQINCIISRVPMKKGNFTWVLCNIIKTT